MAEMTTASLLMRRLRGRSTSTERDLADCGTAFGLDESMAPEPTGDDVQATKRRSGWWRRVAPRRAPPRP